MKWGPEFPERHDLSSLGLLGTDGEPINPKAWLWYLMVIGHIMISPLPAITDTKPGSATRPRPGIGAAVLDESSGEDAGTEQGLLVLRRRGRGCCARSTGRGPRHRDRLGQVRPRHLRGRRGGRDRADRLRDLGSYQGNGDDQLISDIREHVAKRIGKLARPKRIIWADDLPKTRSGKIMRWLLREHREGASSATSRRCATPTSCSSSRRRSPSARAGRGMGGVPSRLQFS